QWILDSGASEHMSGDINWMKDLKLTESIARITAAGGRTLTASSCGSVNLTNHLAHKVTLS
ncbi:hypothetical protein TREMEDRAFT_26133, partial [Tremella mesenterica DSM 1558]|uniref:uncharacterized protein n=1 Tax=Tremella mesenterica (strain ATCC 24925 / CBS 8224 / DSM 1558 / NBRC 9311 / NRRL Y-6157 / RJB 2259-6 / UBC 559-6) TaxID=578456 RepID=UPI0003F49CA3